MNRVSEFWKWLVIGLKDIGSVFRKAAHRAKNQVQHPAISELPKRRSYWRLSGVGVFFGLVFYSWSMTPSLLPRPWYLQGVATGISIAMGYGIGLLIAWLVRRLGFSPTWSKPAKQVGWLFLGIICAVEIVVFAILGSHWQYVTRQIIGVESENRLFYVLIVPLGIGLGLGIIWIGRLFYRGSLRFARFMSRFIPPVPAKLVGGVATVVLIIAIFQDGVLPGVLGVGGRMAAQNDKGNKPGVVRPLEAERSGSPESAESWESLGRQGRAFVALGPRPEEIEEFTGEPAKMPIRVYAGFGESEDISQTASQVVAELERTGAFEREVLAVVTTTGTGWVDRAAVEPLEYIHNGDTAVAAMQYSYLPSVLSFLADREPPKIAGRELFEQIYAKWSQLDEEDRPKLVVFGESLGSYGGQAAFSGLQDMLLRTDGAVFVGTPNFSEPWGTFTTERDSGSSEMLPILNEGKYVRFAQSPEDLEKPVGAKWEFPRVVYLQNTTDPIVWWSTDLLFNRPEWLSEDLPKEINPEMTWFPLVTFWQVSVDLAFSIEMPDGYGHNYQLMNVDAWAAVVPSEGWDEAKTLALREHMDEVLDN